MRRFSGRLVVGVLAIAGGYAAARFLGLKPPGSDVSSTVAPVLSVVGDATPELTGAGAEADGNAMMTRVLATLENWPNIAARFRHALHMGDQSLRGAGEYWQRGIGNQRLTCWQWKSLVGDLEASYTQIYDRNAHVWTDCRMGDRREVTRIDVKKFRRDIGLAMEATAGQGALTATRADELERSARGGLSQTIAELRRSFEFGPPTTVIVAGQPLVAVVGRWRSEMLAAMWPGLTSESGAAWPEHLPHHVVVKVGPQNYFPYVIEYRRGADAALAWTAAEASDPLARYEFFEVQWAVPNIADRLFEFAPSEVDWKDVTSLVVERLKPSAPPAEVASRQEAPRM